jgi:hypothetical protein
MIQDQKRVSASGLIILVLVLSNVIAIKEAYIDNEKWYWVLFITLPLLLLAIVNIHDKHSHRF